MDATTADQGTSGRPAGPVWMTYPELAQHLGITADAARQRANRGRWRRQRGNDGKPRVLVEPEVLQLAVQTRPTGVQPDVRLDVRPAPAPVQPPEPQLVAALEAQIGFLKDALDHERARADREQARVDELIAKEIAALRATLEELRRDREEWRRQPPAPVTVPSVAPRRPWWRRLTD